MILATLCYVKDKGRTLMLHRIKKQGDIHIGKWNGLGGKLEEGESPEECAIREVQEESGLIVEELELKGVLTFPNFDGSNDWYVFAFVIRKFSGELTESPEGQLQWIEDEKLLDLNLWEGDRIFLPWLENDRFFSAKFTYRDGLLKDHHVYNY